MRPLALLAGLPLLAITLPAFAKVVVFPVQATNLAPGDRQALGALLAQSYQAESAEETISPRRASPALRETDDYRAAAAKLGANEYLATDAVRLGQNIVITATRYAADGSVIHTAKATAHGLEDLEVVTERLARALKTRTAVADTRTPGTVTKGEGDRPERTWVEKIVGIKASGDYWIGYGVDIAPTLTLSFDVRLEGQSYFLEFGAGFLVSAHAPDSRLIGGVGSEIGVSFYLTDANIAPYAGAGVLPRILEGDANIAGYAQAGIMLMRESSSRVYFDVRAAQALMPIEITTTLDPSTGLLESESVYPTELSLNAGIGW